MSDHYESNLRAIIEEETYWLSALEAAAEDTRQRDLTRTLGQAECRANHSMRSALTGEWLPCPCGAVL